ncbi:hypothetical protein FB45DRAFT_1031587 [Roridomyces roridus]|uniref:F-box domain-containing protein n=1 Tax=Roridomyces roridus TaxID=1738132 RepID=A0AAD7FH63_9AGAR|nr:hypothetical protein FB45DRAFT_1031587 [Roridomyces roridus]
MTAESDAPAALTFPPDLVPELHGLILSNLPYEDLLRVKSVAKKWKALVESDPALQVLTFKKSSSTYRDNGVDSKVQRDSQPMKMHPALQRMSWMLNQPASEAEFYLHSQDNLSLASAGVLDDLATIPAIHTFLISLGYGGAPIIVKSSKGITVLDVLNGLVEAAEEPVDVGEDGEPIPMYEAMGDHIFYEGFSSLTRTGTKLFAMLDRGS